MSHRILFLLLKTRNTSPFHTGDTGICDEGEGLYMCCISLKSNGSKHRKPFIFFQKKCYPEISSLSSVNLSEARMCILKKKTEYSVNEIVFLCSHSQYLYIHGHGYVSFSL